MARSRSDLHVVLTNLVGQSVAVYFQPTTNTQMAYPCLVYKRDDMNIKFADNIKYLGKKRYQVTVIDRNPDSNLPDLVSSLPECSFNRFYTSDDLNHDVYTLYF